ncbi:hypothetical protein USB125703_01237 [Pseudoclavibacter triregionum]|nr:hypothetical protein USB125703_01237 [Pseudoclavibacter triregionum]
MARGESHSVSCADAVRTTPEECKCACEGDFHGGPHTERVRALVWEEGKRHKYSRRQVAGAKRKARQAIAAENSVGEACTDLAVTCMIDELILVTATSEQQVLRDTLKSVLDPFVKEIVDAELDDADSKNIETAVNNLHVICTLCVEVLKLIHEVKGLANAVADDIAQKVVDSLGQPSFLTGAVKTVLTSALARSFEAIVDLAADPLKVKMLQVVGFATCPNVDEHPDVEVYCIGPLGNEYVTSALHDWIDKSFPADSVILQRAPRRKKAA